MRKVDIDRLLEGRRLTEEYERHYPTQEAAARSYINKLQKLGFNSPKIFFEWNDKMNRIAFKECVTINGHCDNCTGYEGAPPEPPCLQLFTKGSPMNIFYTEGQSCFPSAKTYEDEFQGHIANRQSWSSEYDKLMDIYLRLMRIGHIHYDLDKTKTTGSCVCPEGHGVRVVQVKDLPFEIEWERR